MLSFRRKGAKRPFAMKDYYIVCAKGKDFEVSGYSIGELLEKVGLGNASEEGITFLVVSYVKNKKPEVIKNFARFKNVTYCETVLPEDFVPKLKGLIYLEKRAEEYELKKVTFARKVHPDVRKYIVAGSLFFQAILNVEEVIINPVLNRECERLNLPHPVAFNVPFSFLDEELDSVFRALVPPYAFIRVPSHEGKSIDLCQLFVESLESDRGEFVSVCDFENLFFGEAFLYCKFWSQVPHFNLSDELITNISQAVGTGISLNKKVVFDLFVELIRKGILEERFFWIPLAQSEKEIKSIYEGLVAFNTAVRFLYLSDTQKLLKILEALKQNELSEVEKAVIEHVLDELKFVLMPKHRITEVDICEMNL